MSHAKSYLFFIAMILSVSPCLAEGEEFDLSMVKNPFISKLPVVEIKKTVVEQPVKKPDNINDFKTPVAVPQTMPKPMPIEKPIPHFHVKGLLWGVDHPYAVIDDKVVGINDIVQGARVKSIYKDGVDLTYMGETIHVKMDQ